MTAQSVGILTVCPDDSTFSRHTYRMSPWQGNQ